MARAIVRIFDVVYRPETDHVETAVPWGVHPMAKRRPNDIVNGSTVSDIHLTKTRTPKTVNTKTEFYVPESDSLNPSRVKKVIVQMNVTESRLEENIKNSFAMVKSLGRELDITFSSNGHPDPLNATIGPGEREGLNPENANGPISRYSQA
jgi:hypothetical protein